MIPFMKTILVPTDFTQCAGYAGDFGYELAKRTQSELIFIHVLEIPTPVEAEYYLNHQIIEQMSRDAEGRLKELTQKYAGDIDVRTMVITSSAPDGIQNAIHSIEADTIIIGNSMTHDLGESLFGTNAEKIVRFARCPVILMPIDSSLKNLNRILVAFDPEAFHENIVWEIKGLEGIANPEILFVWIKPPSKKYSTEEIEHLIETHCSKVGLTNYQVRVNDHQNVEEGVIELANNEDIDMLVMSTHARKGFKRWLSGSVTEEIMNRAKIPTMILQLQGHEKHHLIELLA
jgi:nucleotide-binding universal stress UspA family protein